MGRTGGRPKRTRIRTATAQAASLSSTTASSAISRLSTTHQGHTFASETDTEVVAHLVKEWKGDSSKGVLRR